MKRILLLGSQHGDELLGDKLYGYIRQNAKHLLPCITYKTANLRAKRRGVRFIERDMNRSYNDGTATYESRRARLISEYIQSNNFDLVLDLHTTNCVQPPCIIIRGMTAVNKRFLSATHIDKIVEIRHEIVEHSLIGTHSNSIAIEVSNQDVSQKMLAALVGDIERYIDGVNYGGVKLSYIVTDLLMKSDITDTTRLVNFRTSPGGFIPILTGENSYKKNTQYLGFRTDKVVQIKV